MKTSLLTLVRRFALAAVCLTSCSLVHAQTFPPAWTSTATYAPGDIVQYGGNWYRAMKALPVSGPYPASAYGSWELNFVRSNTTLTIGAGQGFANLTYAWTFAHNARIADAAYLHFNIVTTRGTFSENFNAPFSLDHGSGALISIIGDYQININLNFPSTGFTIDSNHAFGTLSGLSINGPAQTGTGIFADNGTIYNIASCLISRFQTAVEALQTSSLYVGGSVTLLNTYGYGLYANQGANIEAGPFKFNQNGTFGGACLYANYNGTISCPNIDLTANALSGIGAWAENGGAIDVSGCSIDSWTTACQADNAGHIVVFNSTFFQNTVDLKAYNSGTINATGTSSPDGNSGGSGTDGSWIYQ